MAHIVSFQFSVAFDDPNKVAVKTRIDAIAQGLGAWITGNKLNSPGIQINSLMGVMELPPPVQEDALLVTSSMPPVPPDAKRLG